MSNSAGDADGATEIEGATDGTKIGNSSDSLKVSVTNLPATQPVSAVSLPLPTGASTSALQSTGNTSIASIDTKTPSLGQALAAASIPVVLTAAQVTALTPPTSVGVNGIYNSTPVAPTNGQQLQLQLDSDGSLLVATADTVFATINITAQDTATTSSTGANSQVIYTGTPTANSTASFALNAEQAVTVQISGTWTGTLQAEISMDGGTTWFIRPIHQTGTSATGATFTANFTGGANSAGYTNFRIRSTAAMTGTATVRVVASDTINTVYLGNGAKLIGATDNTQIGNVSDALKTSVTGITLSAGQVPTFSNKVVVDITSTPVSITSSASYTTIYTYTGAGLLIGFNSEFNSTAVVVKLTIDGNIVFDGNDIGALNAFVVTANTIDRRQNGQGIITISAALDFSLRQPIRFTSSVVISARLTSGAVTKTFNQGVVYIQKD